MAGDAWLTWPAAAVLAAAAGIVTWAATARVVGWLSEKPLQIAAILAIGYLANRVVRSLIARTGRRMADSADRIGGYMPNGLRTREVDGRAVARAATMSTIARSMATAVVAVVAAAWILAVLGVSLAAILASAGVLGVALGFGAQNMVRDVLAGWFILVEDRYGVGDVIDAGAPAVGTVERVTLRSTRLRDINGTVWHVANGEIARVGNKSQSWSRAVIDVAVTLSQAGELCFRGSFTLATHFAAFAPGLREALAALQSPGPDEFERAALAANDLRLYQEIHERRKALAGGQS